MRERLAGRGNEDRAQRGEGGNAPLKRGREEGWNAPLEGDREEGGNASSESGRKKGRNAAFRARQRGRRECAFRERQREKEEAMEKGKREERERPSGRIPDLSLLPVLGGKGWHLQRLRALGFLTPDFFIWGSGCFYDFLGEELSRFQGLLLSYRGEREILEEMRNLILGRELPLRMRESLGRELRLHFPDGRRFAVRSSAVDEDGERHSFAGMMDSVLNLSTEDDYIAALKSCYASCFSERAMEYRRREGILRGDLSIAVIFQEMVEADFSGVLFTTDPATNDPDELLVSLVPGSGEGLVSGSKDSLDYTVDILGRLSPCSEEAERALRGSSLKVFGGKRGPSASLILRLAELGRAVERSYPKRRARDLEFAVRGDEIYLLQDRLITAYRQIDKNRARTILDNANIIESYAGVTTDLTYSFAREVYEKIYRQTLRHFLIPEKEIERIRPELSHMIVFYENKIYYCLNSWYKMTALYPGYEKNKSYMEAMMGVKVEWKEPVQKAKLRKARIYLRFLKRMLRIERDSRNFLRRFERITAPYQAADFEGWENSALKALYAKLEREILDDFTTPIINDIAAMLSYGSLLSLLRKKRGEDAEMLLGRALSRQGGVESAEQSFAYGELVEKLREDPGGRALFREHSGKELSELYKRRGGKEEEEFFSGIRSYIKRFGARSMEELKLETLTLLEDPEPLFSALKEELWREESGKSERGKSGRIGKSGKAHKKKRGMAGRRERNFSKSMGRMGLSVYLLLRLTKYFIRNRERLRLRRTYIYAIVRRIFLRIGKNLAGEGLISEERDIFFLTKPEIFSWIDGEREDSLDWKERIAGRKKRFSENREKPAPPRMYFYGELCPENMLSVSKRSSAAERRRERSASGGRRLCGIPGGGGKIRGEVRIVRRPEDLPEPGFILAAERTDPGWTVLFPRAKALLIERGSLLSHSAVIAREMGLPVVICVPGLTKKLRDGDRVLVNGTEGWIEIEESREAGEERSAGSRK